MHQLDRPDHSDHSNHQRHHFAQLNVGRVLQPLDHPDMVEFTTMLDVVNRIAELSPGFVWRLQTEDGGSSSYVEVFDDPLMLVNMSVWERPEDLRHYIYKSGHGAYLRRRSEWFERLAGIHTVCWWIPAGTLPDVHDAVRRLELLRANGPSDDGFGLADQRHPPETTSN
jgi:Domain of unknown function (DUF3291)